MDLISIVILMIFVMVAWLVIRPVPEKKQPSNESVKVCDMVEFEGKEVEVVYTVAPSGCTVIVQDPRCNTWEDRQEIMDRLLDWKLETFKDVKFLVLPKGVNIKVI